MIRWGFAVLTSVILSGFLSGCSLSSYVINKTGADQKAHETEQALTRANSCQAETVDMRPDATSRSYYRCIGGNCKDHGCSTK